jgi:hypothetical protein
MKSKQIPNYRGQVPKHNRKNSDFLPFGVLRSVLAMVGVVARVVIKVKIDIKDGFGIWLF